MYSYIGCGWSSLEGLSVTYGSWVACESLRCVLLSCIVSSSRGVYPVTNLEAIPTVWTYLTLPSNVHIYVWGEATEKHTEHQAVSWFECIWDKGEGDSVGWIQGAKNVAGTMWYRTHSFSQITALNHNSHTHSNTEVNLTVLYPYCFPQLWYDLPRKIEESSSQYRNVFGMWLSSGTAIKLTSD